MADLFCRYCGAALKGSAKFCEMCGAPVPKDEPEKETIKVEPDMIEDSWTESTKTEYETFTQPPKADSTMALVSMICGIASLVLLCVCIGIGPAIAAIVLGIISLTSNRPGKGMAIAGIVTGSVTVCLFVLIMLISAIA